MAGRAKNGAVSQRTGRCDGDYTNHCGRACLDILFACSLSQKNTALSIGLHPIEFSANPHRWIESGPGARTIELKDCHLPHLYQGGVDLKDY